MSVSADQRRVILMTSVSVALLVAFFMVVATTEDQLLVLFARLSKGALVCIGVTAYQSGDSLYGDKIAIRVRLPDTMWFLLPLSLAFALLWRASGLRRATIALSGVGVIFALALLRICTLWISYAVGSICVLVHTVLWPLAIGYFALLTWFSWWGCGDNACDRQPEPGRE